MNVVNRHNAISVAKELWPNVDFNTTEIRYIPDEGENIPIMPDAVASQEEVELKKYGRYIMGYSSQFDILFIGLRSEA